MHSMGATWGIAIEEVSAMCSIGRMNLDGDNSRDVDVPLMARPDVFCAVAKHEFFLKYLRALTGVTIERV